MSLTYLLFSINIDWFDEICSLQLMLSIFAILWNLYCLPVICK